MYDPLSAVAVIQLHDLACHQTDAMQHAYALMDLKEIVGKYCRWMADTCDEQTTALVSLLLLCQS